MLGILRVLDPYWVMVEIFQVAFEYMNRVMIWR